MKDSTKNTVQKGFRCDTETARELDAWLERHGLKNSQALSAIIEVLKMAEERDTIPGRSSEVDNFQILLKQVSVAYLASLQYAQNAEERVRADLLTRIEAGELSIKAMQDKMKMLEGERDMARDELADTRNRLVEAQQAIEAKDKVVQQQADAIKDKTELIEQLRAERTRDAAALQDAAEVKSKFEGIENRVRDLECENMQLRQSALTSDIQRLILDHHQDTVLMKNFWK